MLCELKLQLGYSTSSKNVVVFLFTTINHCKVPWISMKI